MADDSGLEGGIGWRPGDLLCEIWRVHGDDQATMIGLRELEDVPWKRGGKVLLRHCRGVSKEEIVVNGVGFIGYEPKGTNGFAMIHFSHIPELANLRPIRTGGKTGLAIVPGH